METDQIAVDPWRLCRACGAERSHMFPLSARDPDSGFRWDNMLTICTNLKILQGDGLPRSICYSCAEELKTSFRFKQRCETTDRYFKGHGLKSNGISEAVIIPKEIKEEPGDSLIVTETVVFKQEKDFSELTQGEIIHNNNLEESPLNEDSEYFRNKNENQSLISKKTENELSLLRRQREETILGNDSEESSINEDQDSEYFRNKNENQILEKRQREETILGNDAKRNSLRTHRQTHETARRFGCACGKSYSTRSNLANHRRTRCGARRFECGVCAKSFSTGWYLGVHGRTHERVGRARLKCDVCGKSFSTGWYLGVHRRTHEDGYRKLKHFEVQ